MVTVEWGVLSILLEKGRLWDQFRSCLRPTCPSHALPSPFLALGFHPLPPFLVKWIAITEVFEGLLRPSGNAERRKPYPSLTPPPSHPGPAQRPK